MWQVGFAFYGGRALAGVLSKEQQVRKKALRARSFKSEGTVLSRSGPVSIYTRADQPQSEFSRLLLMRPLADCTEVNNGCLVGSH